MRLQLTSAIVMPTFCIAACNNATPDTVAKDMADARDRAGKEMT
jgi:hypothetical protein